MGRAALADVLEEVGGQIVTDQMIYATNKEWLGTLYQPEPGTVYIMSEDGVFSATCFIGSLEDGNGVAVPVPEGLAGLQREYCQVRPVSYDQVRKES